MNWLFFFWKNRVLIGRGLEFLSAWFIKAMSHYSCVLWIWKEPCSNTWEFLKSVEWFHGHACLAMLESLEFFMCCHCCFLRSLPVYKFVQVKQLNFSIKEKNHTLKKLSSLEIPIELGKKCLFMKFPTTSFLARATCTRCHDGEIDDTEPRVLVFFSKGLTQSRLQPSWRQPWSEAES